MERKYFIKKRKEKNFEMLCNVSAVYYFTYMCHRIREGSSHYKWTSEMVFGYVNTNSYYSKYTIFCGDCVGEITAWEERNSGIQGKAAFILIVFFLERF